MKTVLIVEDDDALREALTDTIELAGYRVVSVCDGQEAIQIVDKESIDMVVSDVRMEKMDGHQLLIQLHKLKPGLPVLLMTAYGTIHHAVDAIQHGAVDYILKPFDGALLIQKIERYSIVTEQEGTKSKPISSDPNSEALLTLADRVAPTDATILISGESGTGKEVLAKYIHDNSTRKDKAFIAINCAAIPEQMLEATLFGYEKGAFTGAYKSTPGKFELADGGTLLLDEISEMDLSLQAKLLRVLQEREVERIGGTKTIKLNVRIIATTNRNMQEEVANKRFREDLYYRLNVFPLHWIPLRDRKQDIIPLANYLIERHWDLTNGARPSLTNEAIKTLVRYDWPGNAREMDNVIQRAIILHSGNLIQESDLQGINEQNTKCKPLAINQDNFNSSGLADTKKKHEFDCIINALQEFSGNRKNVSEKLGVSERTLRYKLAEMRKHGYEV